jgi:hypothetical protein
MTVALECLGASAAKASAVLVGLLESPKDHVRLKAAETIVRLARRAVVQENANKGTHANGSDDEVPLSEFLTPHQMEEIEKAIRMRPFAEPLRTGKRTRFSETGPISAG